MLRLLATGVALLALGAVFAVPSAVTASPPDSPKPPDTDEFIRKAITDGLTEDGVPLALIADLGKRDDFLGKCRLCQPTHRALAAYGEQKVQPIAKEGKGLPDELVNRLKSDKATVRQPALRELVARYMVCSFAKTDLPTEQKTALQADLERMRKEGVGSLPTSQKFCPSCDGVCRLVPKP
jgi:hypothetical protein